MHRLARAPDKKSRKGHERQGQRTNLNERDQPRSLIVSCQAAYNPQSLAAIEPVMSPDQESKEHEACHIQHDRQTGVRHDALYELNLSGPHPVPPSDTKAAQYRSQYR